MKSLLVLLLTLSPSVGFFWLSLYAARTRDAASTLHAEALWWEIVMALGIICGLVWPFFCVWLAAKGVALKKEPAA